MHWWYVVINLKCWYPAIQKVFTCFNLKEKEFKSIPRNFGKPFIFVFFGQLLVLLCCNVGTDAKNTQSKVCSYNWACENDYNKNAEFKSNLLFLCYNFVIIYTADRSVLAADTIVSACCRRGSKSVCSTLRLCNLVSEEPRFWVVLCNHNQTRTYCPRWICVPHCAVTQTWSPRIS